MTDTGLTAAAHLKAAIRNALVLIAASFVIGVLTGWALGHWHTARVGAIVGGLVGVGFVAWYAWMFYSTKGVLHEAWAWKSHDH